MKGVLDRIEDGKHAVILVEGTGREFVVSKELLPKGSSVHDWLEVTIEDNQVTAVKLDKETTKNEQEKSEALINRVRAKSKGSMFKRK
ncbi:DUF3006 domain-containing protein [Sediminibacillus albus]|uniref:DUF3006 domain-containing protein n=1 Tax=Sediminibacillus albus TaxID=407036 RepID=A0A1G8WSG1_9BACI|nr:DUF3006 domain-containing protein [Sediminibacillus albus]SDJ80530.1 Protein of unknown function [Sediminibacillus albus]